MSNELLNYHIKDGEPCGDGATLDEIADYYGDMLSNAPRWISVKDHLPKPGMYLVKMINGYMAVCNFGPFGKDLIWQIYVPGVALLFQPEVEVTHWKRLPAPPDAGKDE